MRFHQKADLPLWVQPLFDQLSPDEQSRLLDPHPDETRAARIQEAAFQVLEASRQEGEPEMLIMEKLRELANTQWS